MKKHEILVNKEQAEFIIKAIDSYMFTISDVLSYEEIQYMQNNIVSQIQAEIDDLEYVWEDEEEN